MCESRVASRLRAGGSANVQLETSLGQIDHNRLGKHSGGVEGSTGNNLPSFEHSSSEAVEGNFCEACRKGCQTLMCVLGVGGHASEGAPC